MAYPDDFDPRRLEVPRWAAAAERVADFANEDVQIIRAALRKILPHVEYAKSMGLSIGGLDADDVLGTIQDALEGDDRAVAAKNRERIMDNAREAMG